MRHKFTLGRGLAALLSISIGALPSLGAKPAILAYSRTNTPNISVVLPPSYISIVEREPEFRRRSDGPTIIPLSLKRAKPLGGTTSDVGWICRGSLPTCATLGDTNYWIDQTNGQIALGSPTDIVRVTAIGKWTAYEAFPLCGRNTPSGSFYPSGGQCYAVWLESPSKVVSFEILLGPNGGCAAFNQCWASQLKILRRMFASLE